MSGEIPEKKRLGFSHAYELATWGADSAQAKMLASRCVDEGMRIAQLKAAIRRTSKHASKPSPGGGGGGGARHHPSEGAQAPGPVTHTREEPGAEEEVITQEPARRYRSPAVNWQSMSSWLDDQELKIERWAEMPRSSFVAMISGCEKPEVDFLVELAGKNLEQFQSLVETLEQVQVELAAEAVAEED